jgi:hypothetical protein
LLAGIAPTAAFAKKQDQIDRKEVIKRAKSWTSARVPYSQRGHKKGYRRDCSGFISMAWDIPANLVTWNIPLVAKRIKKSELQPGDVLLNKKGGRGGNHVVMFEKWANKRKTKVVILEQTGASGIDRAIRRVVPYPYKFDKRLYKPYRYVGMKGYYKEIRKRDRQTVKGYKGRLAEKKTPSGKPEPKLQPEQTTPVSASAPVTGDAASKPAAPNVAGTAVPAIAGRFGARVEQPDVGAEPPSLTDVIKAVYRRGYVGDRSQ